MKYGINYGFGMASFETPFCDEVESRFYTLANQCFGIRKSITNFEITAEYENYTTKPTDYIEKLEFSGDVYIWREDGAMKMLEPWPDDDWNTDTCEDCCHKSFRYLLEKDGDENVEEKIIPPTRCPNCDTMLRLSDEKKGKYEKEIYACPNCNYKYKVLDIPKQPKPDPNNPYTEFAKEMSLLHEALKVEGFKDAMVDILAAMTPEVWKKVQFEEQKHFLHKAFGIDIDRMIKEINEDNRKREDDNWQRIRKEVMCDESSS